MGTELFLPLAFAQSCSLAVKKTQLLAKGSRDG
jgi:hypothetical protein